MTSTLETVDQVQQYEPETETTTEVEQGQAEPSLQELIDGLGLTGNSEPEEAPKPVKLTKVQREIVRTLDRASKRVSKMLLLSGGKSRIDIPGYLSLINQEHADAFASSKGINGLAQLSVAATFETGNVSPFYVAYAALVAGYFVGQQVASEKKGKSRTSNSPTSSARH